MKNSYDSLNDTFNTDPVEDTDIVKEEKRKSQIQKLTDDVSKDYDYTRGNLYSLIEKGQEAINGIMEVAGETASPRAYEVAGQLIKSVADTTDKLADLHKKVKEIEEDNPKKQNTVTNNALFVTLLVVLFLSSSTSFTFFCKSISLSVVSATDLINCPATSYALGLAVSPATSIIPLIASCPFSINEYRLPLV